MRIFFGFYGFAKSDLYEMAFNYFMIEGQLLMEKYLDEGRTKGWANNKNIRD